MPSSGGLGLGDAGLCQRDEVDGCSSQIQGPLCLEASGIGELGNQAGGPIRSALDGAKTRLQGRQIGPTLSCSTSQQLRLALHRRQRVPQVVRHRVEERLLFGLCPSPGGQFVLRLLVEAGVLDRHGRLGGEADRKALRPLIEDVWLRMTEKEPSQHLTGARDDGHGEIADNRQVARRHTEVRRILAEAFILTNIGDADCAFAAEGRAEKRGIPRQWKLFKRFTGNTGDRVEGVILATFVKRVIEKGPEAGAGERSRGIRHGLNQRRQIELGGQQPSHVVDDLECCAFLSQRRRAGPHRRGGGPQLHLGHGRRGQILERLQIFRRPGARTIVEGAEGADRLSIRRQERNPGVTGYAQLAHARVIVEPGINAGIGDEERFAAGDRVRTQTVGQGQPGCGPRLRESHAALAELDLGGGDGDQGAPHAKHPGCQPGEAIEGLLMWRSEKTEPCDSRETVRTIEPGSNGLGKGGRHRASVCLYVRRTDAQAMILRIRACRSAGTFTRRTWRRFRAMWQRRLVATPAGFPKWADNGVARISQASSSWTAHAIIPRRHGEAGSRWRRPRATPGRPIRAN